MKTAVCTLESVSPYSQSRYYKVDRKAKELDRDYEARTWRERCHYNTKGQLFIPPMAFANNIKEAARFASLSIPGKGKMTYTKHFEAGILVSEPLPLSIMQDQVEGEWLFVPSDGRRGGGRRVEKHFPLIREWSGTVTYYILDDIITQDVFAQVLSIGGALIGLGRFRPRNMGYYGRFRVVSVKWSEGVNV